MISLELITKYIQLGFTHIIPFGFDHILFILSLFFLNSEFKSVLIQCSLFTLAHSITLGLAATGYILPKSDIIEPLISISIIFTSIENIFHNKVNTWRLALVFCFGLIHGMGFANSLSEIGLSKLHFISSLLCFNLGVEFGQITIILLAFFSISIWFRKKDWYKEMIVYPISTLIACIAIYWTIHRLYADNLN